MKAETLGIDLAKNVFGAAGGESEKGPPYTASYDVLPSLAENNHVDK